jgi:hypothetical protein
MFSIKFCGESACDDFSNNPNILSGLTVGALDGRERRSVSFAGASGDEQVISISSGLSQGRPDLKRKRDEDEIVVFVNGVRYTLNRDLHPINDT